MENSFTVVNLTEVMTFPKITVYQKTRHTGRVGFVLCACRTAGIVGVCVHLHNQVAKSFLGFLTTLGFVTIFSVGVKTASWLWAALTRMIRLFHSARPGSVDETPSC